MDCTIVGASFAGLACATVLARRGLRVRVLERKLDPGDKLHTTGIIVKEVVDQIALFDHLPAEFVRPVPGVRLERRTCAMSTSTPPATTFSPPIPRTSFAGSQAKRSKQASN